MNRRKFLAAAGATGLAAVAGCTGQTTVQEDEVNVQGDIELSKIELDVQNQENGEFTSSSMEVTIYPEDNVVCYGDDGGESATAGCVRDKELTEKYLEIYQKEKERQQSEN